MLALVKKEFENQNESQNDQFNVIINSEAIQKGLLIKELGTRQFCILVAILSHIDENGQAFPSQRRLSELTGMTLPTINKGVKQLLETKINGEYLLSRELLPSDVVGEFSLYMLNKDATGVSKQNAVQSTPKRKTPVTAENIVEYVKDKERTKALVPKDYLLFHSVLCKEHLNITVIPNYRTQTGMVKNKLMAYMPEADLIEVIEYVIVNYNRHWYSDNYPVPTIGMLSSWLLNEAIKKMKVDQRHEEQKAAVESVEYDNSMFLNL